MKTKIVVCRKSDRELRTLYADEPEYRVRDKYIRAALGNRQLNTGKWSINLDENLVLAIQQTTVSITGVRNPFGPCRVVRHVGGKHPSSAGH